MIDDGVTFYWRPGCAFCLALRRQLRRAGIPFNEVNIWDNTDAAAIVRSVANGNETVPTVVIGKKALVNPSIRAVRTAIGAELPHLLPAGPPVRRWWRRSG